jgi:hypothetical protein
MGEVKSNPAALSSQNIENQCLNSLFLPSDISGLVAPTPLAAAR